MAAAKRPPEGLAALFIANDFRGRHASAFVVVTEDGGDWDAGRCTGVGGEATQGGGRSGAATAAAGDACARVAQSCC